LSDSVRTPAQRAALDRLHERMRARRRALASRGLGRVTVFGAPPQGCAEYRETRDMLHDLYGAAL